KIITQNRPCQHPTSFEGPVVLEPMLELFPDGEFFGIDFKKFIDKIDGQNVRVADKLILKK
ncbi:hypothetical protein, partial [Eubacterium sp.]|uniref:hypothetical protein n=1 Tax=Eubacterium sp. TaxID=142586 RepID=UPI0040298880